VYPKLFVICLSILTQESAGKLRPSGIKSDFNNTLRDLAALYFECRGLHAKRLLSH
jgi:hypothetical protein